MVQLGLKHLVVLLFCWQSDTWFYIFPLCMKNMVSVFALYWDMLYSQFRP